MYLFGGGFSRLTQVVKRPKSTLVRLKMIPRWHTALKCAIIAIKCVVTIDFRSHRGHSLEMSNSVYLVSDSERFYVFYAPVFCVSTPQR